MVDIGTTTLVASLVDLSNGQEIAIASALNPQSLHAQDVLSRIHFATEEAGLKTMHMVLIEEINRLTGELARASDVAADSIYEMVFSGNTSCSTWPPAAIRHHWESFPIAPSSQGAIT